MKKRKKRAGKSKRSIRSRLGTLLLVAGVLLALFPFLSGIYTRFSPAAIPVEPVEEGLKRMLVEGEIPPVSAEEQKIGDEQGISEYAEKISISESYPEKLVPEEAVLYIPVLDVMTKVNYGVEPKDLKTLPGFYPQSGYPDTGNVSIAAHRNAWFKDLDKLEPGDEIRLYYNGKVYSYGVDNVFVTHNRDWSVIDPTTEPALTLTTCHPPGMGGALYRLIARAYLESVRIIPSYE